MHGHGSEARSRNSRVARSAPAPCTGPSTASRMTVSSGRSLRMGDASHTRSPVPAVDTSRIRWPRAGLWSRSPNDDWEVRVDELIVRMLPAEIRARHGEELADMLLWSRRPLATAQTSFSRDWVSGLVTRFDRCWLAPSSAVRSRTGISARRRASPAAPPRSPTTGGRRSWRRRSSARRRGDRSPARSAPRPLFGVAVPDVARSLSISTPDFEPAFSGQCADRMIGARSGSSERAWTGNLCADAC